MERESLHGSPDDFTTVLAAAAVPVGKNKTKKP
jgi:hypothetical protein